MTPKGITEKTSLTYEFIKLSYQFYNGAREKLRRVHEKLENEGSKRIVFYGAGDLSEIAYISTQGTSINLIGIVDSYRKGRKFFNIKISDP